MKNSITKKRTLLTAAILLILLAIWLVWANKALQFNEITVTSERLPQAFDGYRIAQISDLHNAEFGQENAELLQMLTDAQPDMIVLTGDLVDSSHTDLEVAIHFVQQAVAIAPTYYVTGNHEAWLGSAYGALEEGLSQASVIIMRDEAMYIERESQRILLMGVDDPEYFEGESSLYDGGSAVMLQRITSLRYQEEEYTILLSHRPELFDTYVAADVDLVFSGHAHGGQFRLPFIGGLVAPDQGLFPEYDAGLYSEGRTNMVVSRGLGNSIIPLRVGNRPEVVVVELRRP